MNQSLSSSNIHVFWKVISNEKRKEKSAFSPNTEVLKPTANILIANLRDKLKESTRGKSVPVLPVLLDLHR